MSSRIILVACAAIGGAVGTAARHLLTLAIQERASGGFPIATLRPGDQVPGKEAQ